MPKKRINHANEFVRTTASSLTVENDVDQKGSLSAGFKRVVGSVATGAFVFSVASLAPNTIPQAEADEVLIFCGAGDPACNVENELWAKGYIQPGDTTHRVPGPYQIAPLVGGEFSAQQSSDIAAANARNMLQNIQPAPGEDLVFIGYSEGTLPAADVAWDHTVDGRLVPGVRNVVVNGPTTSQGAFENEIVKKFAPIVQSFLDVPMDLRAPAGSEAYGHENDVWAYSADSDIGKLLEQGIQTLMGPVHAVQHRDGVSIKWTGPDGIEYTKFIGPAQGVGPNGFSMGAPMPESPAVEVPAPVAPPPAPRQMTKQELVEDLSKHVVPNFAPPTPVRIAGKPSPVLDNMFMQDIGLDGLMG